MLVNKENVKFNARGLKVAGILNISENAEDKKNPAIVCVHPGSRCKEQTAGIYAKKFAELGYITIVFASCQGESEGEPRYIEDPSARVEDIRSAVDYLTTLDFANENRIGVLDVCAGGGYAVNAAMTERRIKAVGTVVGANIGRVNRESSDPIKTLEVIAKQRAAEARGAETMIVNWIPRNQEEREQAGITDIDNVEAVDYYTTSRGWSPNSPNKLNLTGIDSVIGFDAFHLADELLTQPLQIIVGSVQGAFGSYRDGHELYNKAASKKKDLFIVEGASHYDLYNGEEPVRKAVEN